MNGSRPPPGTFWKTYRQVHGLRQRDSIGIYLTQTLEISLDP